MALTRRQKEVLDFIRDFVADRGYSPSYEEMAAGLQLASIATIHKHVQALEAKDYLKRNFNQSRSLAVTDRYLAEQQAYRQSAAPAAPEVPLLGRIAAGMPIESVASQNTLAFSDFAGDPDTYALEVRGDSMIDDHICSGDFVLVRKTNSVRNGDIVVALVDGTESTLKRFFDEGHRVRLQPANSTMGPIYVDKGSLDIQGKVLAVLRKY
jgi:repressor LexA